MKTIPHLFFSLPWAEGEPPVFDPFPGDVVPFAAVLILVGIVLLTWWLLQFQVSQIEPVEIGHGGDHDHDHAAHMEAAPAAMAEPPADLPPEMPPPVPDDLKKLEGIGPRVEAVLKAAGIETFAQLAAAEVDRLAAILDEADYQYMNPGSWPEQARLAADEDWDALQKLMDELTGGMTE
jgi:predicted flap endonuclease-1-like 5' DNA nuclease